MLGPFKKTKAGKMELTEYETTMVFRPDISGDIIEAGLDRLRNRVAKEGKLLAINHWGKKRLAYPIQKHTRGVYVHAQYLGKGMLVSELERDLRLSEDVIRFLTVKVQDEVNADEAQTKEYVRPEYNAAEKEPEPVPVRFASDDHDDGHDHEEME